MPITANDPFSEVAADLAKAEAQGSQPGASGAEIPVTVHASRYSAAKGAAKLPPIHEETRTVIIFPQGAVVRLSATVTPGELVVLTNNRSGSDVICRVTDVKAQAGIQSYVHLEFTQRAVDFWQEPAAAPQVTPIRKAPSSTAMPQLVPKAPNTRSSQAALPADPVANASPLVAEMKPSPAAVPQISPLADDPAGYSEVAKPPAVKARSSETPSTPAPVSKPAFVPSSRPQLQPFEASIPQKSTSKSVVVFAVAAVVLLSVCGVTATILLRQDRTVGFARNLSSDAAKSQPSPVAPAPATPISNSSAPARAPEPVSTPSLKDGSDKIPTPQLTPVHAAAEPSKAILTEPSRVALAPQPAAQAPARPALNVGKLAAPRAKTATQLNSPEPPPVLSEAGALPSAVSENLNGLARANAPAVPAPAVPAPVRGGQLQEPKLLSSVSAVYPSLARSQRLQGDVTIDALIDADGNVASTKVVSGNPLLQNAASDALRRWKYQPARLDGQPIPVHINVTITFRLN